MGAVCLVGAVNLVIKLTLFTLYPNQHSVTKSGIMFVMDSCRGAELMIRCILKVFCAFLQMLKPLSRSLIYCIHYIVDKTEGIKMSY